MTRISREGAICESSGAQVKEAIILATGGTLIGYDARMVYYEIDRSTGDVAISGSVSAAEPVIIAAYTKDGKLIGTRLVEAEGTAKAAIPAGAATLKIFWVEKSDMQPLSENAVVEV